MHKVLHYTVDGKPQSTAESELSATQILENAGVDPKESFLIEIRGDHRESYHDHPHHVIQMHDGQIFESSSRTVHFSVDDEVCSTMAHNLTPKRIMELAGVDAASHYLVRIVNHHQESYEDSANAAIHVEQNEKFITVAKEHRRVTTMVLGVADSERKFSMPENATLLEVLQEGAERSSTTLLPTSEEPLDRLHNIMRHDEVLPPIIDLAQSLADFLKRPGTSHVFGIELVQAFRVNTRWAVAPTAEMTPHQILDLFGLNYQDYTLYRPNSADPLALDSPVAIERGTAFEAQRDGKYGDFSHVP